MRVLRFSFLALFAGGVLLAIGCQSRADEPTPAKINQANFDRIHKDMTRQEVVDILGPPSDSHTSGGEILGVGGSVTSMTWRLDDRKIEVKFLNDKVLSKEYKEHADHD